MLPLTGQDGLPARLAQQAGPHATRQPAHPGLQGESERHPGQWEWMDWQSDAAEVIGRQRSGEAAYPNLRGNQNEVRFAS